MPASADGGGARDGADTAARRRERPGGMSGALARRLVPIVVGSVEAVLAMIGFLSIGFGSITRGAPASRVLRPHMSVASDGIGTAAPRRQSTGGRGVAPARRSVRRCRMATRVTFAALALLIGACTADPGYQGRSSRDWIRALDHPDPDTRADAANALGRVLRLQPRSPAVVAALISALDDPDDRVRVAAGIALSTEGVRAPAAVLGLVEVLRDTAHANVRSYAASILGAFGPAAVPAVPALTNALDDADPRVRAAAAAALRDIGPAAASGSPAVIPALVSRARDPAEHVQLSALEALLSVEAPTRILLPVLETALTDVAPTVRARAAYTLAALGPRAAAAAPIATRALADPEPSVRAAAAVALGAMGPSAASALRPLTAAMRDQDPLVATAAADAVAAVQGRPRPPRSRHDP